MCPEPDQEPVVLEHLRSITATRVVAAILALGSDGGAVEIVGVLQLCFEESADDMQLAVEVLKRWHGESEGVWFGSLLSEVAQFSSPDYRRTVAADLKVLQDCENPSVAHVLGCWLEEYEFWFVSPS